MTATNSIMACSDDDGAGDHEPTIQKMPLHSVER